MCMQSRTHLWFLGSREERSTLTFYHFSWTFSCKLCPRLVCLYKYREQVTEGVNSTCELQDTGVGHLTGYSVKRADWLSPGGILGKMKMVCFGIWITDLILSNAGSSSTPPCPKPLVESTANLGNLLHWIVEAVIGRGCTQTMQCL